MSKPVGPIKFYLIFNLISHYGEDSSLDVYGRHGATQNYWIVCYTIRSTGCRFWRSLSGTVRFQHITCLEHFISLKKRVISFPWWKKKKKNRLRKNTRGDLRKKRMSKSELDQLWELQGRQAELRRHVLQLTSQLAVAERERAVIDISVREMDAMADDTRMYMSVGKMFVLSSKQGLRTDLLNSKEQSLQRDQGRKSLREQFIQKLRESETRIDEIVDQIDAARSKHASTKPSASS